MQIVGVDLHTRQQTVAMLNVETWCIRMGVEKSSSHELSQSEIGSDSPGPRQLSEGITCQPESS